MFDSLDEPLWAAARRRIAAAYDPELIARAAPVLGERLQEYFREAARCPTPALPPLEPSGLIAQAREAMQGARPAAQDAIQVCRRFAELAAMFLGGSNRLHSPHYLGHQVPPPVPISGLFDGLAACVNQPMAVFEMGPFANAAERAVVGQLAERLGWAEGTYDAIGTHGGSIANLTAILAARNVRVPGSWAAGSAPGAAGRPAIVTSVDSHYSVARAAGILGLGTDQVIRAPVDARRRLCPERLTEVLEAARRGGQNVFCLVASACSTPTGAFDPLEDLADAARRFGLWLHVDGAHGASVLLSARHRDLVRGIERADSITWDAHKMLFVPALCTFLFYREAAHSRQAFQQDAPYISDPGAGSPVDTWDRTLECTKRPLALPLWGIWSLFGPELFEDLIDVTFDLARRLHGMLAEAADFWTLHEPQCNIVCFQHVPESMRRASMESRSAYQLALRSRLVESGEYYITTTRIDGEAVLRTTLIHPLTDTGHLAGLLEALRRHGRQIEDAGLRKDTGR